VTPAFLLLKLGPGWAPSALLHQLLAGIAALYFCCTALRLARFNVENSPDPTSHKRFRGLPSPGAAGCIAALAILRGEFPTRELARLNSMDPETARALITPIIAFLAPIGGLCMALLMVSNVTYPHVTGKIFRGRKHLGHLIQVLLAGFLLVMFRELAALLVFWGYALVFPMRSLLLSYLRPEPAVSGPPVDEHAPHKL
jgi:phosphatidylserine synthase